MEYWISFVLNEQYPKKNPSNQIIAQKGKKCPTTKN